MESILNSTKKKLGIGEDYTHFDDGELIDHINTTFMVLTQLGVGPSEGFIIEDDTAIWDDFISEPLKLRAVRTYVFQKAKLIFDPPTSSAHMQALKESIAEFEWRLNAEAESQAKVE